MSEWHEFDQFVRAHACQWSRDPTEGEWGIHHLDTPPHNRLLGPVFPRGDTAGLVSVGGEVHHTWGDTTRSDMTFSVTKTYLAMVAGIAVRDGLIKSVDETVEATLARHGLECESVSKTPNTLITWRHFLNFTSEWEGACFGIPDQVDHYRVVSMQPSGGDVKNKGDKRVLHPPGTYWEYNDVRINQFALLLTRLFDRSIPEVFNDEIMQKIGGSDDWHWYGYSNSSVKLSDGSLVHSVPGGGHWGGGMVISVHDQFLLAQLLLNGGRYGTVEVLPADWVDAMTTPCSIAPWYGYFMWLNSKHCISRVASERSFFAMGIGGQLIWHEPERELVAVFRWIDAAYTEQILERCERLISA